MLLALKIRCACPRPLSLTMKVTIVGGGIGGLTCALSLHAAGISDVDVYESVPVLKELGVGVNLLPHSVRELDELGLLPALYETAVPTAELAYLTQRGQFVWREERGLEAGYHWPQFSIHRGQLLGILYRAVIDRLGENKVHLGHHLQRFDSSAKDVVRAEFGDSENGVAKTKIDSDLLIACDGVHSTVRNTLYPQEGPPIWNGTTMWRGVTVGQPFLGGKSMIVAGRFTHRVVAYPIAEQYTQDGLSLINWVAEKRVDKNQQMPQQDWQHKVDIAEVLGLFSDFEFPFLSVKGLIKNAQAIFKYPMVDREPLTTWIHGRVTLLGDAAHPMYPVGSNGASQAIIDARTIAHSLATTQSPDEGLSIYDEIRRPATSAIVRANRGFGPERCIELVEERAPNGFEKIEDVISRQELQDIALSYKKTAGFDPKVLNNRPSLSSAD